MTSPIAVGDYIRFVRTVHAEQRVRHRADYATGRAIVVPEVPEQILPQRGEGEVVSIAKTQRKVDGEKVHTARVACGKPLGVVTAVLDDAVLSGKSLTMFDIDPTDTSGPNMYGSDAKGIA